MEYPIYISHELVVENATKRYSLTCYFNFKDDFDEITNVEIVKFCGKKRIKVTGTLHLYGFKISDDCGAYSGFYDIINQRWYPKGCREYQKGRIIANTAEVTYLSPVKPKVLKKFISKKETN